MLLISCSPDGGGDVQTIMSSSRFSQQKTQLNICVVSSMEKLSTSATKAKTLGWPVLTADYVLSWAGKGTPMDVRSLILDGVFGSHEEVATTCVVDQN